MYTLYHNPASTCSQKVRWVFAEKAVPFNSHEIDLISGGQHDPAYVALNPKHVVPTLVHDDQVILESSLIIQYLNDCEPTTSLIPTSPLGRYHMSKWIALVDHNVHPAAPIVTFAIGPRKLINSMPAEVREANIAGMPDERHRAQRRSVLEHGVDAPEFVVALEVFINMLDEMESTLAARPWLAGDSLSLAEGTVLPYVLRISHLGLDPLIKERPKVKHWFEQMQDRASFKTAVSDWMPPEIVEMLSANGKEEWPAIKQMLAAKR